MDRYSVCGQHSFLPLHECRGLQNEAKMKIPALLVLLLYRAVDLKLFLVVLPQLCSNALLVLLTVLSHL